MRTIWKYALDDHSSRSRFDMPEGAELLHVQAQGGAACVWALVDPSKPPTPRGVVLFGTGHDIPDWPLPGPYIGTFQTGPFVFHAFEDLSCIERQNP